MPMLLLCKQTQGDSSNKVINHVMACITVMLLPVSVFGTARQKQYDIVKWQREQSSIRNPVFIILNNIH